MELIRRPLHRHTQGDQPPPPTPIHFIGEDVEKNSHVKRTSLQSSQWIIRVLYLMGFIVRILYPSFLRTLKIVLVPAINSVIASDESGQ